MTDKVDMSLDDIVKSNRGRRGGATRGGGGLRRGRGGPRGAMRGAGLARRGGGIMKRRSGGAPGAKTSPFKAAGKVPDGKWLHDMYGGAAGRRASSGLTSGPTKIIISNLDYGVNDKDIKELFQDFGPIRKAAVHYDRSGRSLGTADVLFEKRQDAIKAINKYNGVQLDGRPMDIQLSTGNTAGPQRTGGIAAAAAAATSPRRGGFGGGRGGRGGFRGGRGGRGGGARGGRNAKPAKTQAELDADLDTYNKMQTD